MNFTKKLSKTSLLLLVLLFLSFSTKNAHAYLDPGTGSFILQVLAAGALGGLFAVKTFWGNITTFFSNILSKNKKTADSVKRNNGKR